MGFKGRSFIKIILILFLFFQNVFCSYGPFTNWSINCFRHFPVWKSFGSGEYKILTSTRVEETIKKVKDKFKNPGDELKDMAFMNTANWLNKKGAPPRGFTGDQVWDYVQKVVVPAGSKICFMGDIHGSLHSLLRNLWGLVDEGYLDDYFRIVKDNFYIVFLGDFVDRGAYGIEVFVTLMHLKLANWDKVFLLRGNHEEEGINRTPRTNGGFFDDLKAKFGKHAACIKEIFRFYRYLPLALFLGVKRKNTDPYFFQCCHGGINPGYDPSDLMSDKAERLFEKVKKAKIPKDPTDLFDSDKFCDSEDPRGMGSDDWPGNFNWCDFFGSELVRKKVFYHEYGRGLQYGRKGIREYLHNTGIKTFFRGHQHSEHGLKIIHEIVDERDPWDWREYRIFDEDNVYLDSSISNEITLTPAFLAFTLSTAPAAFPYIPDYFHALLDYDCYGILTTANTYEQCKLKVYESKIKPSRDERANKYVSIDVKGKFTSQLDEGRIAATWGSKGGVGQGLIDKAKKNRGLIDTRKRKPESALAKKIGELQGSLKCLSDGLGSLRGTLENTLSSIKGVSRKEIIKSIISKNVKILNAFLERKKNEGIANPEKAYLVLLDKNGSELVKIRYQDKQTRNFLWRFMLHPKSIIPVYSTPDGMGARLAHEEKILLNNFLVLEKYELREIDDKTFYAGLVKEITERLNKRSMRMRLKDFKNRNLDTLKLILKGKKDQELHKIYYQHPNRPGSYLDGFTIGNDGDVWPTYTNQKIGKIYKSTTQSFSPNKIRKYHDIDWSD